MRPSTSRHSTETLNVESSATRTETETSRPTAEELESLRGDLERARGRRFELITRLSRSSCRDTWKALDTALDRLVTIKYAPTEGLNSSKSESATYQKLLRQDAKITARLQHHYLATIHDVIEAESHVSVVMEYVEGVALVERALREPIPADEALPLFIQLAEVLDHLHHHDICLGRVDPSHVIIDETNHIKLLNPCEASLHNVFEEEFEASLGGNDAALSDLPTGSRLERPDLFSLGCLLYEAVSGEDLFGDDESVNRAIAALVVSDSDSSSTTGGKSEKRPGAEVDPSLLRLLVHLIGADDSQYFGNGAEFIEAASQLKIVSLGSASSRLRRMEREAAEESPRQASSPSSEDSPRAEATEPDTAATPDTAAKEDATEDNVGADASTVEDAAAATETMPNVEEVSEPEAPRAKDAAIDDVKDEPLAEDDESPIETNLDFDDDSDEADQALSEAEAELTKAASNLASEPREEPKADDEESEPGPNDTIAVESLPSRGEEPTEDSSTEDEHQSGEESETEAAEPASAVSVDVDAPEPSEPPESVETGEPDVEPVPDEAEVDDHEDLIDEESLRAARAMEDENVSEATTEEQKGDEPGDHEEAEAEELEDSAGSESPNPYAQTVMMAAGSIPSLEPEPEEADEPKPPEYEFQGRLDERSLGDVIRDIYVNRRSGTLIVVNGELERSIYFRKGSIVFASSTQQSDWLGSYLVREEVIEQGDLDSASSVMQETGDRLGVALVGMGLITDEQLQPLVESQVANIIYSTFGWDVGEYAFETMGVPLEESIIVQISTANTILEGIRRNASPDAARNALGDLDRVLSFSENPLLLYQQVALTSEEGFLLSRVDGTTTAAEAASLSPLGEDETLRSIYALVSAGVVELLDPDNEKTATPASMSAADLPKPDTDAATATVAPPESKEPTEEQKAIYEDIGNKHASLETANYYQLLEVSETASAAEIKTAYYKMVKKYHPDGHHALQSLDVQGLLEDLLTKITDAYEVLYDEDERSRYDGKNGTQRRVVEASPVEPEEAAAPAQTDEERAAALLQEGQRHFNNLAYFDAIQCLRESIRLDETSREAYKLLAMALRKNPNWVREAATHFNKALEFDPSDVQCYQQLGEIYDESGLATRARRMFEKVLELDPGNERATLWLAEH